MTRQAKQADLTARKITAEEIDPEGWEVTLGWPALTAFYANGLEPETVVGVTERDLCACITRAASIVAIACVELAEPFTSSYDEYDSNTPRPFALYDEGPQLSVAGPDRKALTDALEAAVQAAERIADARWGDDRPLADVIRTERAKRERERFRHQRIQFLTNGNADLANDIARQIHRLADDAADQWLDNFQHGVEGILATRAADAQQAQQERTA